MEVSRQNKGGETVNKGPGKKPEPTGEFDVTGNVMERGEDPSPTYHRKPDGSFSSQWLMSILRRDCEAARALS